LADPGAVLDMQWHEEVSKALQGYDDRGYC